MDEETRKRLEYEEQFFGMSSGFFADSFKSFIKDELDLKITMLVDNFKSKLIKETNNAKKFEIGLKTMKKDLIDEYQKSLNESFPEMESKISGLITIPKNVLLKEDLPVRNGFKKNLDKIKEDIENLKGTFKSLLYLKQEILEELEEADSAIILMECIINGRMLDFEVLPVEDIAALSKVNNLLAKN